MAIRGNAVVAYQKLNPRSNIPGIDAIEQLVSVGMTVRDDQGNRRPQLAEAVPTIENGLWKLFPDGRMETTWTIKPGVQWQDGHPFTADDLAFTVQMSQDKDLPIFGHIAYSSIEGVEAADARSLTVKWKQPYIDADVLFSYGIADAVNTGAFYADRKVVILTNSKEDIRMQTRIGGDYLQAGLVHFVADGKNIFLGKNGVYIKSKLHV